MNTPFGGAGSGGQNSTLIGGTPSHPRSLRLPDVEEGSPGPPACGSRGPEGRGLTLGEGGTPRVHSRPGCPSNRLLNQTNGNQFQEQSLFFQVPITNVCIFREGDTQASRNRDSAVPSGALPSGAYLTHRWAQPGGVDGGRRGLGHPGQQEAGPCRSGAGWVVTSIVKL